MKTNLENQLETTPQKSTKEQKFSEVTQAILTINAKPITAEELFNHFKPSDYEKFSPKQKGAAGVALMGKRFASMSVKVYKDVLNQDAKYDLRS